MSAHSHRRPTRAWLGWAAFFGGPALAVGLGLLAAAVGGAQQAGPSEPSSEQIGQYFAREHDGWAKTKDMAPNTRFGGSSVRDYLAADPKLVVLFAGYAFSKEYNQARGHYHAIEDVTGTKRVGDKTPATCWTCKSPQVPQIIAAKGKAAFYAGKFMDLKGVIKDPIGCADCHNPQTMELRISRPALKEALIREGKNPDKLSRQDMRSLVCAQCHVSYYFKDKQSNYLVFPWDDGKGSDGFDKYYERVGFSDWTHPISGAKMIKLRHPDYEIHTQGVHAFRGVSCADCHMPARGKAGDQFTDHQIRSPLYNLTAACGKCHKWSEDELRARVYSIQDKNRELLDIAERALVQAHLTIGDAAAHGATDAELEGPRHLVRRAQMYWDYVAANNGMGFHAPQECARSLAKATDMAQQCRIDAERVRAKHGALDPVAMPDLSTKEKAWSFTKPYEDAQKAAAATAH